MRLLPLLQAPIAAAAATSWWLCVPDRPNSPPSEAAAGLWKARDAASASRAAAAVALSSSRGSRVCCDTCGRVFIKRLADMRAALSSLPFVSLLVGYAVCIGMGYTLLSVQSQLLAPCGYSTVLVGSSSGALLLVGIGVSVAVAPLARAKPTVLAWAQKATVFMVLVSVIAVLAALQPGIAPAVIVTWCVVGGALQPLIPLSFEIGAQLTYPTDPDTSATLLCVAAEVTGFLLTIAASSLLSLPASSTCQNGIATPFAALAISILICGTAATLPLRIVNRRPHMRAAIISLTVARKLLRGVHRRRRLARERAQQGLRAAGDAIADASTSIAIGSGAESAAGAREADTCNAPILCADLATPSRESDG